MLPKGLVTTIHKTFSILQPPDYGDIIYKQNLFIKKWSLSHQKRIQNVAEYLKWSLL